MSIDVSLSSFYFLLSKKCAYIATNWCFVLFNKLDKWYDTILQVLNCTCLCIVRTGWQGPLSHYFEPSLYFCQSVSQSALLFVSYRYSYFNPFYYVYVIDVNIVAHWGADY